MYKRFAKFVFGMDILLIDLLNKQRKPIVENSMFALMGEVWQLCFGNKISVQIMLRLIKVNIHRQLKALIRSRCIQYNISLFGKCNVVHTLCPL